ncbi:PREDICTED: protein SPA1-RELATED 3 isoform X2 [Ipomoea nil]|uniref:protein SPA1-RELATED 3 isoform X2 n=1 Tax=Ipomoea nil TaxID=35883 RepID=UPI0009011AFB|nr:PREDICTED: protein SPA1-RELATED 3 isoform X2 [Ipomoea nil]
MSVYLSKRKCAIMEGSSETGWNSSSRGLNYSSVVDRNPRVIGGSSVRSSSDASPDSASIPARKGREGIGGLPYIDCIKPQGGVSGSGNGLSHGLDDDNRDVSLRQWLDNPERTVDSLECLHIFTQIVNIVNLAHSQGIVVHNVRPSCFVMSSFNRVAFIESASCSHSGSESLEDGLNSETAEFKGAASSPGPRDFEQEKEVVTQRLEVEMNHANAMQTLEADKNQQAPEEKQQHSFPMKKILLLETNWYTSPEEVSGETSLCASDVYRLGVLLFELFCTFHSPEEKSATMSSLRHRVLPPQLLLKWPKEASFCLWLLHPQPSSRPNLGELLQSEFLNDPRESLEEWEGAIALREKIDEQDLLLEFLLLIQQRKQEVADSLNEIISFLSSDLEGVTNMQSALRKKGDSNLDQGKKSASNRGNITEDDDSGSSRSRKRSRTGFGTCNVEDRADEHETPVESQGSFLSKSSRLVKNFRKLESAYFLTRRRALKPAAKPLSRYSQISSDGRGSIGATERSSVSNLSSKGGGRNEETQSGWINSFLEGLCKYLSFSKLEEKANLKQGDLLNSSNLVCSLSFDRDGEFFATAGVNKKIKVFEYNSILKQDRDIHYPVVEMSSRSKLSSICWNSYVKSQIASSNFEGVVQVWDVTRSQLFMEMKEHERRVWSVDFSVADPTLLASGSDDGSVKLWNINQAILLLHLVDVSFETKRRLCRDHQNESERVLRSVPFRFRSYSCVWFS